MFCTRLRQPLVKCLHIRLYRNYSMNVQQVVQKLNSFAPVSLAESWDNVGLLVEPYTKKTVQKMLLTNDLTEEVVDEAEQQGADFILSYHPPVFRPLKRITSSSWKERIVARCLERGIAVYSPHTAHDALKGGVNDWLISAFDCKDVTPLQESTVASQFSHEVKIQLSTADQALALERKLKDQFKDTFQCSSGSHLIVQCQEKNLSTLLVLNNEALSDPAANISITKLEKIPKPGYGMGRLCKLATPITVLEAVNKIKTHLGLPHVRVALAKKTDMSSEVVSVSVCAGSGASVLRGKNADLWVTGEMSHHEVLDAAQNGTTVILADHSNSERGFLASVLRPQLTTLLEDSVQVLVSEKDRDPLQVV